MDHLVHADLMERPPCQLTGLTVARKRLRHPHPAPNYAMAVGGRFSSVVVALANQTPVDRRALEPEAVAVCGEGRAGDRHPNMTERFGQAAISISRPATKRSGSCL